MGNGAESLGASGSNLGPMNALMQATPHAGIWDVPDGWQQGRGAWGGLVVTAAIRAAVEAEGAPRPVRSVFVSILAPVPVGEVSITTTLLRRGSATSAWQIDMRSHQAVSAAAGDTRVSDTDEVLVQATVLLGDDRHDVAGLPSLSPPSVMKPWREVPIVPLAPPAAPPFTEHLEFRLIQGIPYSGKVEDIACWVRAPDGPLDYAALIGLVDAMWPVPILAVTEPRPMATLTFSASVLVDPATLDPAEPLLHVSTLMGSSHGYVTEHRQLWTPDGRLAVDNPQVIVIIR
jgi:hypothetical protein